MDKIFLNINGNINKNPSEEIIDSLNISEYLNQIVDHKGNIKENFNNLNEYYGNEIPSEIVKDFKRNPRKDFILENLQTHDSDKFIKQLIKNFTFLNIKEIEKTNDKIRYIKLKISINSFDNKNIIEIINSDRFQNIVNFYGYLISKIEIFNKDILITFEPKFTENANELVYVYCEGKIFHITELENLNSILENGLRITGFDSKKRTPRYRNFPKRSYFLALKGNPNEILKSEEMQNAILSFKDTKNIAIIIADVRDLNINFYKDVSAKEINDFFVFTYANIPPNRIKCLFKGNYENLIK